MTAGVVVNRLVPLLGSFVRLDEDGTIEGCFERLMIGVVGLVALVVGGRAAGFITLLVDLDEGDEVTLERVEEEEGIFEGRVETMVGADVFVLLLLVVDVRVDSSLISSKALSNFFCIRLRWAASSVRCC